MALTDPIPVLDHGFVRLDAVMADDLSVVNGARVSFAEKSEVMSLRDEGLIKFLMRERHGTPFEHNAFRFHVKAPLFVFREWHRHRVGHSYNEWSARYSKMEPEFYIPNLSDVRTQVGKPGAYTYEQADFDVAAELLDDLETRNARAYRIYEYYIEKGLAKEQARLFLPVGIYSQMYWTTNARALMHWLGLRNADNAQWEIRQYAIAVENIFATVMPVTAAAFVANSRITP